MLRRLKAIWKRLEEYDPGERFVAFYREHRNRSPVVKAAFFGIALVSFAAGVLFAFIPGPAILFFALSAALLASQSLWVARWLDKSEIWGTKTLTSARNWWRRRARPRPK
jgi:amino acid permease